MGKRRIKFIATFLFWALANTVAAHGGGLDANGCHFKRSTGEYHCHRGGAPAPGNFVAPQRGGNSQAPNYLIAPQVDSTCYTGPRGGRYRIVNGRKRYGC